jgi:hypothetical protein
MPESKIVELLKVSREYFDLDARRYRQLADEGKVPKPEKGKIELFAAARAIILYERSLRHSDGGSEQKEANTRRDIAKAEREELIVKKLKGELVLKDQVETWLHGHVEETKSAFWGLPRRMGPVLTPISDEKEIEFLLREAIYQILEEMAKPLHAKKQSRRKNSRIPKVLVATP